MEAIIPVTFRQLRVFLAFYLALIGLVGIGLSVVYDILTEKQRRVLDEEDRQD